jgi:two-component system, OmpR family, sensor kinase
MSLSGRLTLWYTAITGLAVLAASAIVYLSVAGNLQRDMDASLQLAAQALSDEIVVRGASPFRPLRLVIPDLSTFSGADLLVQVVDARGAVLDRSESLGRGVLPFDANMRRALADDGAAYATLTMQGGRLRVYAVTLVLDGRPVGALQVARPLASLESAQGRLLQALAAVDALLLLVAAGGGWALARGALRPIAAVTGTADAIARSGDLRRRVPEENPSDEVGALAATFNRMLDRVEAALTAQRRFVADASHELRTPLTTLRVNLATLRRRDGGRPAEEVEILDDLDEELDRLSRLVGGLLALARADAGQPLELTPLALDAVVRDVYRAYARQAQDRSLVLEDAPPLWVLGSADHLQQVVRNLVENALKYTPPGGHVWLALRAADGGAELTVRDDGVGIRPEDLPHVFERFYRAPAARSRPGAGLGLSIADWIVRAHGGRISVESAPAVGSTFRVWLPALPAPATPDAAASEDRDQPAAPTPTAGAAG